MFKGFIYEAQKGMGKKDESSRNGKRRKNH
jgi:hypothetical protein